MRGRDTGILWPDVPGLVSRAEHGKRDGARYFQLVPGVMPQRDWFVHNKTLRNLHRGIVERVLYLVKDGQLVRCPRPSREMVIERLGEFRAAIRKKLPPTTPVSLLEFPDLYEGRKRLTYLAAARSLLNTPVSIRDAKLKWFTKFEKLVKEDPAPRIISPRDPRYNVAVGLWLKPAEHKLFKGIARVFGETTVAKGLNAQGVGDLIAAKWFARRRPVALMLDAKRFDQHTSYEVIRYFEHKVYADWFRDPEFNRIIAWQLHNVGVGVTPDGFIRAEIEGCRMSGDMNTSSGNCLIMCSLVWSYARYWGLDVSLVNNGDDCVVFMEQGYDLNVFQAHLNEWFLELGYEMEMEAPVYELEQIDFCQARPVAIGGGHYLMVRNIVAVLGKDSMALINADHKDSVASWCAEVGKGGTACYGGIPVLDAFYRYYERQGAAKPKWAKAYQKRGFDYLAKGMNRRGMTVLPETRYSFYIAFGLLPLEQEQLEEYFKNLPNIQHVIPKDPVDLPPKINSVINYLLTGVF